MDLTMHRMAEEAKYLEEKNKRKYPDVGDTVDLVVPPLFISSSVDHPPHYNNSNAKCSCGRRIECIDVTRHLNFNIGNAIKYLWRCELKGNTLEDLKKAQWYIQDEIKKRES